MAAIEPFVTPHQCPLPDCEVTLKFDKDPVHLYACKHALIRLGDYFKTMFFGQFKEKNKTEIEIQEVTRSEMLLFLQFTVPVEKSETYPTPADVSELYTLISLSDRFLYPKLCEDILERLSEWARNWSPTSLELSHLISLGERLLCFDLNEAIAEHILCTPAIYGESSEVKLELVEAAYEHRASSTVILEACIRLCANMDMRDVAKLQGKGMDNIMLAVYAAIGEATPKMSDAPVFHVFCKRGSFFLKMSTDKRWWWHCSDCGRNYDKEATVPFKKIMQIEIDEKLLA